MTSRRNGFAVVVLCAALIKVCANLSLQADEPVPASVWVAFGQDCERKLIEEIKAARSEIRIAIFSITRRDIAAALAAAARKGVSVEIRFDAKAVEDENMKETIAYLRKHRISCQSVQMKKEFASMHHKFLVVDRRRVATGSFNYTTAASTENRENLVVIESPQIAAAFLAEFDSLDTRQGKP